jgi:hypothetical protein
VAEDLGLDKMTVWRWRHRIIAAVQGVDTTAFRGIVEADEKFFRGSRKGSRECVDHLINPGKFPKPQPDLRRRHILPRDLDCHPCLPARNDWEVTVEAI